MTRLAVLDRLADHAANHGERTAVREVGPGAQTTLSYSQLHARVQSAGAHLRTCLNPGNTALLITGNRAEFFIGCLAIWSADAAAMPIHPSIAQPELESIIRSTNARLALTDPRCAHALKTTIPQLDITTLGRTQHAGPQDPGPSLSAALLLQSSGTTGLPKIAIRPAPAIDAVARNVANAARLSPADTVFAAIPICHSYGIENGFLAPLWAGSTVNLCDGLDLPAAMAQLGTEATVFPGVPFMFEVLAKSQGAPPLRPSLPPEITLAPEQLAAVAGTYRFRLGGPYAFVVENGRLVAKIPGWPQTDLIATSPTVFHWRTLEVMANFDLGASGQAERVVLIQAGHPPQTGERA